MLARTLNILILLFFTTIGRVQDKSEPHFPRIAGDYLAVFAEGISVGHRLFPLPGYTHNTII